MTHVGIWIAGAAVLVGCKGDAAPAGATTGSAGSAARAAPPAEPRIPAGAAPVELPTIPAPYARRVQTAETFVAIDKTGARSVGAIAAGANPYAGEPLAETDGLAAALYPRAEGASAGSAGAASPGAADPRGSATPDDAVARQQAIEAARSAGVLGATATGTTGAFASLTGGGDLAGDLAMDTVVVATREAIGALDTLVMVDRAAPATLAVRAIDELTDHRTALAVAGTGAPDAAQYRFGAKPADERVTVTVVFPGASATDQVVTVTADTKVTALGGPGAPATPDAIARALRPDPAIAVTSPVEIVITATTSTQQLVDALAAAAAANVTEVRVTGLGGFGFGGTGTIGHGSGTLGHGGYGVGAGGRPRADAPQVRIGQPGATGDLDKAIIRRYVKRNVQKLVFCYEKQLVTKPTLAGRVDVDFYISETGAVTRASATGLDPEVSSCVTGVIKGIVFPPPKGGAGVQVKYPFTFLPKE